MPKAGSPKGLPKAGGIPKAGGVPKARKPGLLKPAVNAVGFNAKLARSAGVQLPPLTVGEEHHTSNERASIHPNRATLVGHAAPDARRSRVSRQVDGALQGKSQKLPEKPEKPPFTYCRYIFTVPKYWGTCAKFTPKEWLVFDHLLPDPVRLQQDAKFGLKPVTGLESNWMQKHGREQRIPWAAGFPSSYAEKYVEPLFKLDPNVDVIVSEGYVGTVDDTELVQPTYENRKLEGAEEKLSLAEQLRAGLVKNDNCPGKK